MTDDVELNPERTIKVVATSSNTPGAEVKVTEDRAIPGLLSHNLYHSGQNWIEPGYRLQKSLHPIITVKALAKPLSNITLSDGKNRISYKGELSRGMSLVISPDGSARLLTDDLIDDPAEGLRDALDPTGFKSFSEGYVVLNRPVHLPVEGGDRYRVTISGKAEGGANSMAVLRVLTEEGERINLPAILHSRFDKEWRDDVSEEIVLPENTTHIELVYLYRLHDKGRIWYGGLSIERGDGKEKDVSDMVSGSPLVIKPGTFTVITYYDEVLPTGHGYPKLRVQLSMPGELD